MRLHDYTAFQRDLLVIIHGLDTPSGQTIKEAYERVTGATITHGRLYPNLDTLVENGLVEKGTLDRRTNYYTETQMGRDAIEQLTTWYSKRVGIDVEGNTQASTEAD